jgi:hypothetical protein
MSIDIASLPAPQQISNKPIATAAQKLAEAKAAADEAAKSARQAELELPAAADQDARDEARARRGGSPSKRTRSHVAAAEKALDDLRHEARVTALVVEDQRGDLEAALQEHGAAYVAEVEKLTASLDVSWTNWTRAGAKLHAERSRAVGIARKLGSDHPPVGSIPLKPRELMHENAGHLGHTPAYAAVPIVLDLLAQLGEHLPEQPPESQRVPAPNVGRLVWEDTSAGSEQVQAFMQRAREQAAEAAA